MTGGAEKIFLGAQINIFLKFGINDQKKVFIPNYAPWIPAVCLPSGHDSRSAGGRHVHCLAGRDGISWCGIRFLTTNSGIKTKVRSSARNLSLRLGGHSCSSNWNETLLTLWGHKQYFLGGGKAPKCTPVAFWRHNPLLVGTVLASEAQAVIGGTLPRNAPLAPGLSKRC